MKTSKSRHDTAVQGTNDSSIVSKCSLARLGYFNDDFLQLFVHKQGPCRRAPLIHRGYYIRAKAVDFILREFLRQNEGRTKQVLSLGAGFDSTFFRLKSEGLLGDTMFIEVDFPDVVRRKSCIILQTEELRSLLQLDISRGGRPLSEIDTDDYKLLGADLSQLPLLESALKQCDVRMDNPTLILSECALTYMSHSCATNIIRWASTTFSNSVFMLYEQIKPHDAFGKVMMNHYDKIGSPLRCIDKYPTLQSQLDRFLSCGWSDCEALDMNHLYDLLVAQEERFRIEKLEPFDEFEEWHLKCAHYIVLCAYNGNHERLLKQTQSHGETPSLCEFTGLPSCELSSGELRYKGDNSQHVDLDTDRPKSVNMQPSALFGNSNLEDTNSRPLAEPRGDNHEVPPVEPRLLQSSHGTDDQSLLIQRFGHVSSQLGNAILTAGGFGVQGKGHGRLTDVVVLDVNSRKTAVIPVSRMSGDVTSCVLDRLHHSAVTLSDGSILVVGGRQSPLRSCDMTVMVRLVLRNATSADPATSETNSTATDATDVAASDCHEVTCDQDGTISETYRTGKLENPHLDSKLGGDNSTDHSCELDITAGQLSTSGVFHGVDDTLSLEVICSRCRGDIPSNRWRHSAVVYRRTADTEEVLIYGGKDLTHSALEDYNVLGTTSQEWTKVLCGGKHPGPRHSHTANMWQDHMIIAGGVDSELSPLNTIHLLHLGTNLWQQLKLKQNLKPRYSHTARVIGDVLILVGGVNLDHTPPGLAMVCLQTGHCQEYTLPHVYDDKPVMYHNHTSFLTENHMLWILGGGGNCFSFGTHLNVSPFTLDIGLCLQHFKDTHLRL